MSGMIVADDRSRFVGQISDPVLWACSAVLLMRFAILGWFPIINR